MKHLWPGMFLALTFGEMCIRDRDDTTEHKHTGTACLRGSSGDRREAPAMVLRLDRDRRRQLVASPFQLLLALDSSAINRDVLEGDRLDVLAAHLARLRCV